MLRRDGEGFDFYLQFYRKTIVTVVLNADFQSNFTQLDPAQVVSRSYSTRIAEVTDHGTPNEREKPVGNDHGYLWRLNTYARLAERDGGVYFQLETIGLTRRVPTGLGWLVNPYVQRIPRESLALLLTATRKAVNQTAQQPSAYSGSQPRD